MHERGGRYHAAARHDDNHYRAANDYGRRADATCDFDNNHRCFPEPVGGNSVGTFLAHLLYFLRPLLVQNATSVPAERAARNRFFQGRNADTFPRRAKPVTQERGPYRATGRIAFPTVGG